MTNLSMKFNRRAFAAAVLKTGLSVAGVAATGSLGGCVDSLRQPYPEKQKFLLEADRPNPLPPPDNSRVLNVRRFEISRDYESRQLIFRRGVSEITADFYNEFFTPPADMIESNVRTWLGESGLFALVVEGASQLSATHRLEGLINRLYGDFSGAPMARLDLQLLLLDISVVPNTILVQQDYTKIEPLEAADAASLVRGYDRALVEILTDFEAKLRTRLPQA